MDMQPRRRWKAREPSVRWRIQPPPDAPFSDSGQRVGRKLASACAGQTTIVQNLRENVT